MLFTACFGLFTCNRFTEQGKSGESIQVLFKSHKCCRLCLSLAVCGHFSLSVTTQIMFALLISITIMY